MECFAAVLIGVTVRDVTPVPIGKAEVEGSPGSVMITKVPRETRCIMVSIASRRIPARPARVTPTGSCEFNLDQ